MQNLGRLQTTGLSLELFHVQSNTYFELPPNLAIIRIGKPNDQIAPDIDVSLLPDSDFASRNHAEIQVEGSTYYLVDVGSSNGTYLNNTKLEPRDRYPLNLGDKIELGQGSKITFIFQYKQNQQSVISRTNPTVIQPQKADLIASNSGTQIDRSSKLLGLILMVTGIIILSANTQIGIFFRIPGILLCVAGVVVIAWRRAYRNLGLILIGLGIAVILFTGNVFASVSLLAILASSALFIAGYQLFSSGKILNYDVRSLKGFIKK
ncbi:FHA domain-containing protein [Iningainema tapete]|uniref:FHA domain-containing protein n=1 Tax=Iningainema tapete BLCC-T55 TaxID=2748662 RepID=A0A8J6XYV7_9CYAN|nr:FHA domain-containing protein [Iningainema tapete]MBD2775648.1 FHA domain-containing protein [Iningainema tapete BLCC-T55]